MLLIDEHPERIDLGQALDLLPPSRREKALLYRRDSDRRQSVAAWLLLREACRKVLSLDEVPPVEYGENGKPFFPSLPDVYFNLSHCETAVACVLENHPVGIDVEAVRPLDMEVLRSVMNEGESRTILSDPEPPVAFTRIWTLKESLLKLTGEGLCDNIQNLLEERKGIRFGTLVVPSAGYVCSTASFSR